MDKSEFETRAYANPDSQESDFLEALKEDPDRQQLLDEIRAFNGKVSKTLNSPTPPEGLANCLKSLNAGQDESEPESNSNVVQINRLNLSIKHLALAASLVLAVGVTFSVLFNNNGPTEAELAFSERVMNHVYMEQDDLSISRSFNLQSVNQVIDIVGAQLRNTGSIEALAVTFARPCVIIPENDSAHLAILGRQGAVNVVVVKNNPVSTEFSFEDERFTGVVIPMEDGNLILIGEKQERLDSYRQLLADNTTWTI